MMKRILGILVALVMVTGLVGTVTATPAQAKGYVSKAYKHPKKGQTSGPVKALQYRLVKAKVMDDKYVTSYFGNITEKSVKKFQRKSGLKANGKVSKKTWTKLVKKTGKMKIPGAKTAKKKAKKTSKPSSSKSSYPKKGQTSSKVTELQQRLVKADVLKKKYITGYYGNLTTKAVKKFQKKYDIKANGKVNKKTWKKLVSKTGKIKKAKKPKHVDSRCMVSGRALCIDKNTDKLYYLKNGKVKKTLDARFGCAATKTRMGTFSVLWKSRNHVSTIYGSKMPYSMFFSGGQAVHYSSDFKARGYNGCSHGCVNIRDRGALKKIFNEVRNGDRVVVYRS